MTIEALYLGVRRGEGAGLVSEQANFESNEHAFFCGKLFGTLHMEYGPEAIEQGADSEGDYLPGIIVNYLGKQFVVHVTEVSSGK